VSPAKGTRVIGYVRVSTEEQSASVEAQRGQIEAYCALYGLVLASVVVDQGVSGRTTEREGLGRVLGALEARKAQGVVVAKLDRLTRSVRDLGALLELSEAQGWSLCSVGEQLDTRTATGRLVANVLGSVAQWERETISERTRAALAVKKAQGVRIGRPPEAIDHQVHERVRQLKADGLSLPAIAAACEAEGLTAPRGGKRWHPTTVRRVLARQEG
jgi:site-specific DNA recombinase